ncbi:fused response regulator/phosphatase [Colwellia sp. MB3u-28]|nr:fused response regulator/phosphatase [Colwellia sp. MB02u-7]MBA6237975.1 fused response regulator/phosphatase [Colwellia sp. MB02u-11]MBA6257712.1 fused response regulator/phosphatase [Colwellia sp. MB3u-28]MBA6259469.1 fused response regulator/phosphatase [Colwellia sp. MB3u-41]MBA6300777.1 fused response regulator/phosphatase [Colwellia sp. MB3u-22]MBA6304328.1 fused response regulator/phosphatase [Colwellia sp. MB02u-14]MBA6311324.1 fused response regulator/phosphatase [Colwellia sp. MB
MAVLAEKSDTKLALVVDDSAMQCKVLSVLLKEEGYRVFTANDGARGVEMYVKYKPDLVLMDINMPVMDGYEAARKIKGLSQDHSLCPLIFITSMDTDQAFIECIDAGGDGILVRPFSPDVFKAKIKSIQRISDLYAQVKTLQQEQQKDAELAEQLMSGVIEARNFSLDRIGIIKQPAALFSGDIQLTALSPNGDVNVMLGDFTGHGLRSSIGAIPLAETFRAMTKKGFLLFEIINQINHQLYDLLPADLFLAAGFASISSHDASVYAFNAGLPDAYLFSEQGMIKHKISSSHPPLGVLPKLLPDSQLTIYSIEETDRIILISDGIVEVRNEQGEMFDFERFEQAAIQGIITHNVSECVLKAVNDFCQTMPQEDDISLIDIPCGGWEHVLVASQGISNISAQQLDDIYLATDFAWHWQLTLSGKRLASINPIPMAMNQINEIEGHAEHWQSLYSILSELFVNALDHGVLGLNSKLKASAEGFSQYYKERELRLTNLEHGFIDLQISHYPFPNGGRIMIKIHDSGQGFDIKKYYDNRVKKRENKLQLSGRGIELVEQLCDSLDFQEKGKIVEASYVWAS